MRAALICLPTAGEASSVLIAGRSAAACQLELALACGCELIVLHGHGASVEAITLRHRAERAGARFQTVNDARALIGAIGAGDSLLVLQSGLWAEAKAALEALRSPACVLTLPAGAGLQGGFERIDLDRAWAGALVLPGHLLDGLASLPEDIAPAPALLRVALQHRLPETRLPAELLDEGRWSLLRSPEGGVRHERLWVRLVVGEASGSGISARLARMVLHWRGGAWAASSRGVAAVMAGLGAALLGALVAAWQTQPAAAFVLLALAAVLTAMATGLVRLRAAPFGKAGNWSYLHHLLDAALAVCAVLSIEGLWQRALFAPLVLASGLLLLDRRELPSAAKSLRDRGAVSLAIAALVLALRPEAAIMLAAAIVLAANLAPPIRSRG